MTRIDSSPVESNESSSTTDAPRREAAARPERSRLAARRPRAPRDPAAAAAAAASEAKMRPVWHAYRAEPTVALRNQLMVHYLPLVQQCAQRVHAKLPAVVQIDDLIGAGTIGLMDAIEAFDINRPVRFATFSQQRIRGAMLDELRSMDWAPRLVRTNSRKLDAASRELEARLQRAPSDEEMAAHLNLPPERYRDWADDARAATLSSLSATPRLRGNDDGHEIGPIADPRAADPLAESQRRLLKETITRGLNRAERLVLTLYYYEDLTMREVGQVLDLSESRVSQMHTQLLKRLKATARRREEDGEVHELAA